MLNLRFAALLIGATLLAAPAAAQKIDSAYTDVDLDTCLVRSVDDLGGSWSCPGYKGYPLYIAEGDLRMFVSYGFNAPDEMAAHQTLSHFNTLGKKLEWRLVSTADGWRPFATILRFYTQIGDGSEPDGQVLVVTKLEPGNTCHVAYIDARLTPDANTIARQFADTLAPVFNCRNDEPARIPE